MPFLLRSQQRRSSEGNSTEGPLLLFHINEKINARNRYAVAIDAIVLTVSAVV